MRFINAYWQAMAVGLLLILLTGVSWQQTRTTIARNIDSLSKEAFVKVENNLGSRVRAYTDALSGYKGLFAASEDVSPGEFNKYFVNSNLQTNYPGFLAITYIAAVPENQKQAFIVRTRARATADFPAYRTFAPYPENTNAWHYPVLYTEPHTPTSRYGFDLSSEDVRRKTLEQARDSGKVVGSDIINLNASRTQPTEERPGFFIAEPVYKAAAGTVTPSTQQARRDNIQGFVLAYFQNDLLFNDVLGSTKDNNARYLLVDVDTGRTVYESPAKNVASNAKVTHSDLILAGGKTWRLSMQVSPEFGMTDVYRTLPQTVRNAGFVVAALAFFLVLNQLRRRDQALETAAEITEDLNNERNAAVAVQRKDDAILRSIGDAVFAIDIKGHITLFNLACEQITGFSAEEAIGKHYRDILSFSFQKSGKVNDDFIRQALAGHVASMKNHTVLKRKDGKIISVADSAAPINDLRGQLLGVIVVFRDVSKEYELDKAKTEFVSLASHQLRTPLSAINWYGELLLNGDAGKLTEDQKEYVGQIYGGSQRMIELVNALLDVSRLDLGKLSNTPEPVDMPELALALQQELLTSINSKRLEVKIEAHRQLRPVSADPKLVRMIVQNIFSNAVKYTPPKGKVTITMRAATEQEVKTAKLQGGPFFYMSIQDSGYGIPKSQHGKIFGKLFRADNVRSLDEEGTGLGLYLVKQVVEKLGGKVWFDSEENRGTTFHVLLPFKTRSMKSDTKQPGDA
jgi:PAS domain S-box-containing protein